MHSYKHRIRMSFPIFEIKTIVFMFFPMMYQPGLGRNRERVERKLGTCCKVCVLVEAMSVPHASRTGR